MTVYHACSRCGTPFVPTSVRHRLCSRCGQQAPPDTRVRGQAWQRIRKQVIGRDMPGPCGICGQPLSGPVDIDHRVPRCRGGTDDLSNLRCVHRLCNRARRDRLDWTPSDQPPAIARVRKPILIR